MKVLLTGGSGFLGRYVQEELLFNKIPYMCYNQKRWGSLTNEESLAHLEYCCDDSFTHIIHLAAKVGGIGANQKSPFDFINDNLKMGLNVVDFAKRRKLKVIMVSTVCSYPSVPKNIPFKEEDLWDGQCEPTNRFYGNAKRILGQVLWAAHEQYGLQSIVLNLANLYGKFDNSDLESSHVIPAMISKLNTAKKEEKKAVFWGDGLCSRDFLHANCAARAIIASIDKQQGNEYGYNIGTGRETFIVELAQILCNLMNVDPKQVSWDTSKTNGQNRRVLDCSLAKEFIGWESKITLEEGLKDLIAEI